MKKSWNAPDIEELTIQSTACWYQGWQPNRKPGMQGTGGKMSPSGNNHHFYPPFGLEDETSSI